MKKKKWFAISIFSAKNEWPTLLKNGIQPLVKMLADNDEIISYNLQLNYINSEHIRLALLVPGNLTYKVAQKSNVYFKNLFSDSDVSPVLNNEASNGLFVPYLKNAVHYDLFSTSMLPVSGDLLTLQQELCNLMLDIFSEGVIDNDLIETFYLYLLFTCYKIVPESERLLYAREQDFFTDLSDDFFDGQYNDILASVGNIYNEVNNPCVENTINWLNKWEHLFKHIYAAAGENGQGLICFNNTVVSIHRQLGLNKLSILLINSLILKILTK